MKELTLEARTENIAFVTAFIDAELEQLDCPMKQQMQIDVAADELFANIAHYAYTPETGNAVVQFDYDPLSAMVSITFIDQGIPFNPLDNAEPDVTLAAENRKIGGLGIFIVKKTMDDIHYWRVDGQNHLCVRKRIRN